jgi:hypothetical protein
VLRLIGEIAAAALTASAIFIGHARSEYDPASKPPVCVTESMFLARINKTPKIILIGKDLQYMQQAMKEAGLSPPDDDQIMLFAEEDTQKGEPKSLFVSFKNGCITHAFIVPTSAVTHFMKGA